MFIEICTKAGNECNCRLEWHSSTVHAYHTLPYVCTNVGVFTSWLQPTAVTQLEICVFTVQHTDRCWLSSFLRVSCMDL